MSEASTYIVQQADNSVLLVSAFSAPSPAATGMAVRLVGNGEVMPPSEFRSAWVYGADALTVEMTKAKTIHLANLSSMASSVMSAVRIAWTEAQMVGDTATQTACSTQLEALMQVGSTDLSSATTAAELAAIIPACITQTVPTATVPATKSS